MKNAENIKSVYKTKQQSAIINFFLNNSERLISSKEIIDNLKSSNVGASTVYRQLSQLTQNGTLQCFKQTDSKKTVYRYTGYNACSKHFHMRCEKCGRVFHLECAKTDDLCFHIKQNHGFSIDMKKTVFSGICSKCGGV